MKNWTGTVSKTARAFVACALAFLAFSAGAATVKDIGIKTHYPWNGRVDVTYAVDGIANGSVYHVSANVVVGATTYENVYSTNINANAGYGFTWDAAAAGFKGRVEDAKVVFTVDEPNYAVIDLSAGPTATKYPVAYFCAIDDANIDAYKTDKLLLKRLGSNYVGVFEVTQRQFERVMGENPSYFSLLKDSDDIPDAAAVEQKRPVERVSYEKVAENGGFFDLLCERTGLKLALPTEDEWTTAAKGAMPDNRYYNLGADNYKTITGKKTDNTWLPLMGRYVDLWKDGVKTANGNNNPNQYSDATKGTAIVGSYNANDLGLYDMHGNVSEWTLQDVKGNKVLRGGNWQASAEACSIDARWTYLTADANSLYKAGFRVFGAEPDASFEKKFVVESVAFPIDVDEDNVRQIRVADNNDGSYTFYYTPQDGTERDWVKFDDAALFGGKDWVPSFHGINIATNAADETVIAKFNVAPLTMTVAAENVTVTYDGELHTITGPNVSVPSYHAAPYQLVYWCADKEGQSTRETATAVKPAFADVKYKTGAVSAYVIRYEISSPFYTTVTGGKNLTINPRDIEGAEITMGPTLTYNAKVQTNKVVSVTKKIDDPDKVLTLTEGTDFTVANNMGTDATTYTATLTGIGNYKGTATKDWEIQPLDFGDIKPEGGSGTQEKKAAKINLVSDYHQFVYNGQPQTNYVLSVSINGVELDPSSGAFDAQRIVDNVKTDVGTYKVVVTGIKNFKGNLTNEWTIVPMPITNATVYLDAEFDYNGDCQTRNVTNVTVATDGYEIPANPPAVPTAITIPSYTIDVPVASYYVRGNTGTNASAKVGAYTLGVWAKSRADNNFSGHVYVDWLIGQRDLTNAVFTLDDATAYDYVYNRTGKTPDATAVDAIDDGTHAIKPMVSPSTNLVADLTNDWKIAEYLNNVNVGDEAKVVFAATENGNYRGVVTNAFETGVMPATISSVTITNAAVQRFVYDGTEKVVHRGDVLVTTANGLTLRNDAKPYEFKTSGQNKATATGRYKVTVTPQTSNFINSIPDTAYDTWEIVPAAPELTWTTLTGATNATGNAGTFVYGVKDLTVAAFTRCAGETNIFEFVTPSGKMPIVRDDKFHVTERTTIKVFSVYTAGDGTVLTGAATTVTLAPGVCADPEIFIEEGTRGRVSADSFDRNYTVVTIRPATTVNGVKVGEYDPGDPTKPYWPAWENKTGTLKVWLLDASTNVIAAVGTNEYVVSDLVAKGCKIDTPTLSADKLFVVAQICDTNYLDSIVKTTEMNRVIAEVATPTITITKLSAAKRRVKITCSTPDSVIWYTTSNTLVTAATPTNEQGQAIINEAKRPTGPYEIADEFAADRAASAQYTAEFDVTLAQVDEAVDVKAIAYVLHSDDPNDFKGRSAVADKKDFREWHEGEALDTPDQVFTNGWSQLPVPKFASDDPKADPVDFVSNDVPWFVFKDDTAVGGECMRSGVLTNGNFRTSSISTKVVGAGLVVFHWKANCESDPSGRCEWDHGEFIVDGVVTNKIDGQTGWTRGDVWVDNRPEGHVLTWTYVKDFAKQGGIAAGEDGIFLDNFTFHQGGKFGDGSVTVTVDPLVFNGDFQLPTSQVATAALAATNYIHAKIQYPETGNWYELVEGLDYVVTATKHCAVGTFANDLTLTATPGTYLVSGTTNVSWSIVPMDISNAVVECVSTNLAYTGFEIKPTVSHVWVKHDRAADPIDLAQWSNSYTMTDTNGLEVLKKAAGHYKFQLIGGLNMTNTTAAFDWTIEKSGFDGVSITVEPTEFFYDRTNQMPKVTLKYTASEELLQEGADYTLTWPEDCSNACVKTIKIVGAGATFEGAKSNVTYEIKKTTVNRLDLNEPSAFLYDSNEKSVSGRAFAGEIELTADEWSITNNVATNAATYTAGLELKDWGLTNFVLAVPAPTTNWVINPINLAACEFVVKPNPVSFVYDGTEKQVTRANLACVTANGLSIDTNAMVIACDPKSAKGSYVYSITAGAQDTNFIGTTNNLPWAITPPPFDSVTLANELTWNGVASNCVEGTKIKRVIIQDPTVQTQRVVVVANGLTLTEGADYVLSNNVNEVAGKHTLDVYGINNFKGVVTNDIAWTIKPTKVTITPNAENPRDFEEFLVAVGDRVSMLADVQDVPGLDNWICKFTKHEFVDGVAQPESPANKFRAFAITRRIVLTGWAETKDGVKGEKISVDYKLGRTATPVSVLQDMSALPTYKLPVYDDSGLATTNSAGCQTPTNFSYNAQKIVLTRGNVKSDGTVIAGTEANTNYLDGAMVYTLDGTEPVYTNGVLGGSTMIWTNGVSEIVISETITNIVRVCGFEYFDSPVVTNVFVRDRNQYLTPIITFQTNNMGFVDAPASVKITQTPYQFKLARQDDGLPDGQLVYTLDNFKTTNDWADIEAGPGYIETNMAVTVVAWVQSTVVGQVQPSPTRACEFTCGERLATPVIEFNTNTVALAQYQGADNVFSNKMQKIDIKRVGTGIIYTDGYLVYQTSTNGTDWSAWAITNAEPLAIWGTTWVKAKAIESTIGLDQSFECIQTFTQAPGAVATPTVTFNATPTVKQVSIVLASDPGTTIYYEVTNDGSEPADPVGINKTGVTSKKYEGPFAVSSYLDQPVRVKAIAYREDGNGDFYGRSAIGVGEKLRVETVMDAIKPDDPAKLGPDDKPDASDIPYVNDSTVWQDVHGNWYTNAWFKDETEAVYEGGYSLRSGKIRAGNPGEPERISVLTATVEGPGKVSFAWKSSTEFDEDDPSVMYDFGTFYVDGVMVEQIWGTNEWSTVEFTIEESGETAQTHELKWTYEKDWMDDETLDVEDCIWVDELIWTRAPDMKQVKVTYEPLTFNQQYQRPTFTVTVSNETTHAIDALEEGVHYTAELVKTNNAGTYAYTLHATGTNTTGTVDGEWTIAPLSIANAEVKLSGGQMVTRAGGAFVTQYANVTSLVVGALQLIGDTAWTAENTNACEYGTYTATITGSVNLTNSVTETWSIAKRPITQDMIVPADDVVYAGQGGTNVPYTVAYDGDAVAHSRDTTWPYNGCATNAGTYQIAVTATGDNYTGTVTQDWTVAQFDFDRYPAELVLTTNNFVYSATPHTVDVVRVIGQHPGLGPIAYSNEAWFVSNNVQTAEGEYWCYLYPKADSNFVGGPISNRWTIGRKPFSGAVVTLGPTNTFNGAEQAQTFVVTMEGVKGPLVRDVDYSVEGDAHTHAGLYRMTLTGKGDFEGDVVTKDYVILPESISNTVITLTHAAETYDRVEKTVGIKLELTNGYVVAENLTVGGENIGGYAVSGTTNATVAGEHVFTLTGYYDATRTTCPTNTGNIAGATNVAWAILPRDLATLTITQSFDTVEYDRQEHKPFVGAYLATAAGDIPFVEGVDFKIVWPADCTSASNAVEYVVEGMGSVTNAVTKTYAITPAEIDSFQLNKKGPGQHKVEYNGLEQTVGNVYRIKSTANGLVPTADEYELTNAKETDVGTYVCEVKSTSRNFTVASGLQDSWRITKMDVSKKPVVVTLAQSFTYSGQPQTISSGTISQVTAGGIVIPAGDYEFANVPATEVGTHNDTIILKSTSGNFTGSHAVQWSIEKLTLSKVTAIVWESDRLVWDGTPLKPVVKSFTANGYTFTGSMLEGVTVLGEQIEAGQYASAILGDGSKNFLGQSPIAQPWDLAPRKPVITPGVDGKYTKLADYITVEINNNTDDQTWKIFYTTNDWAETIVYPYKAGKFDITSRTTVKARAVSADNAVTSDVSVCDYYFGQQNADPAIALTAAYGAEFGRPSPYAFDGTTTNGVSAMIWYDGTHQFVTNFYHTNTYVYISRFGGLTQEEIVALTNSTTSVRGLCPYVDGDIWYTLAENGAAVLAPTNVAGVNGSVRFDPADPATWPHFDTNAVVVAQVFGKDLENSAPVTNYFARQWTKIGTPTISAPSENFNTTLEVTLTPYPYAGPDWTVNNEEQKIYVTLSNNVTQSENTFLYTNKFEITHVNMDLDHHVLVKAVAKRGGDYLDSDTATHVYEHIASPYTMPTMTASCTFHHAYDDLGNRCFEVGITNAAPSEEGGELYYSLDGVSFTKYLGEGTLKLTNASASVWAYTYPTAGVVDYKVSETNRQDFTYDPYQFNTPVIEVFTNGIWSVLSLETFEFSFYEPKLKLRISYPDPLIVGNHCSHQGVLKYTTDDSEPSLSGTVVPSSGEVILEGASEFYCRFAQLEKSTNPTDHLPSDSRKIHFTRQLTVIPDMYLTDLKGQKLHEKDDPAVLATNYYQTANVVIGNVTLEPSTVRYTVNGGAERICSFDEEGKFRFPISNTVTVVAWAQMEDGQRCPAITNVYTRKWETLATPKIQLLNPYGSLTNEYRYTADRVSVTNDTAVIAGDTIAWADAITNVTVRYAVVTNSADTSVMPADSEFKPYVDKSIFFNCDSNVVWAIVSAFDYIGTTNKVAFERRIDPTIVKPVITLDNTGHRHTANVTVDTSLCAGANAIYVEYEYTNEVDGVRDPRGSEYDVTKASKRYTQPFDLALKPGQTIVVKATCYTEDTSSGSIRAETNFTARGEIATAALTLNWEIGDALDAPDQEFEIYDTIAKSTNDVCVEDTVTFNYGESSMVFTNLVDSEWVSIKTEVVGPGTVVFDWKTLCEQKQQGWRDHFSFSVDGNEILRIDGATDWQTVTNTVAGVDGQTHTLVWTYKKDESEKVDPDCAWLDHFRWTPSDEGIAITEDLDNWMAENLSPDDYEYLYDAPGVPNYEHWTEQLTAASAVPNRTWYDCYVLGLDPEDGSVDFEAGAPDLVYEADPTTGEPVLVRVTISWSPCTKAGRTYTLYGKKDLSTDLGWTTLNEKNATAEETNGSISASASQVEGYHYFQLSVRMTE